MGTARLPKADEGTRARETRAERIFRAADGAVWSVRERGPSRGGPADDRSLVFESDSVIRRVRRYPADWRALSDEELERLSWKT